MGQSMDYLNDMALFVEVVKSGSFRGASGAAGIPASTLSRRIAALEASLGLRLLHRTTRKVEITEAGQIYYDRARRIVEEARLPQPAWTCLEEMPGSLLSHAAFLSKATGLFPARAECLRRGL